jgi:hypothetical protein
MADEKEYGSFLTEFIQKQMIILGPTIALDISRRVSGLEVLDSGVVIDLGGDLKMIANKVLNEFEAMSGSIAKTGFLKLLEKYPEIKLQ